MNNVTKHVFIWDVYVDSHGGQEHKKCWWTRGHGVYACSAAEAFNTKPSHVITNIMNPPFLEWSMYKMSYYSIVWHLVQCRWLNRVEHCSLRNSNSSFRTEPRGLSAPSLPVSPVWTQGGSPPLSTVCNLALKGHVHVRGRDPSFRNKKTKACHFS